MICTICYYDSDDEIDEDNENDILKQDFYHDVHRYSNICYWDDGEIHNVCDHNFHTVCLYDWIKESKKITCPACRQGLEQRLDVIPSLYKETPIKRMTYYPNGNTNKIYYMSGTCKEGVYLQYYIGGQLKERCNYEMDLLTGKYETFYEIGQIKYECVYNNNTKHGASRMYNKDGLVLERCQYNHDKLNGLYNKYYDSREPTVIMDSQGQEVKVLQPHIEISYHDGKKIGVYKEWYENGKLKFWIVYVNDVRDGPYTEKYSTGKFKKKAYYKNGGRVGITKVWAPNGKLIKKFYKNDNHLIDGRIYVLYPDGNPKHIVNYDNGKKIGGELIYYENGTLKNYSFYCNDKLHNQRIHFSERGEYLSIHSYKNGVLNGQCYTWYPNGSIHLEEYYKDGKMHGSRKEYDIQGQPKTMFTFENDQVTGKHIDYKQKWICYYKNNALSGKAKIYKNNKLLACANYENGVLHGPYKKYYVETGNIEIKCHFTRGKLNDTYIQYHDKNGKDTNLRFNSVWIRCCYKNDKLNGPLIKYTESGKPYENMTYKNGILRIK